MSCNYDIPDSKVQDGDINGIPEAPNASKLVSKDSANAVNKSQTKLREHEIFSGVRVLVSPSERCIFCECRPEGRRGILCVDGQGEPSLCCRVCAASRPCTESPHSSRSLPLVHALAFVTRTIANRFPPELSGKAQDALTAVCQSYNVGPVQSGLRPPDTYAPQSAWKSTIQLRFSQPKDIPPLFYVAQVVEDSPAWYQGLRDGDIILRFGDLTLSEFNRIGNDWKKVVTMTCESFFDAMDCIILRSNRSYDIRLQATQWEHGFILGALITMYPFIEASMPSQAGSRNRAKFKLAPEYRDV